MNIKKKKKQPWKGQVLVTVLIVVYSPNPPLLCSPPILPVTLENKHTGASDLIPQQGQMAIPRGNYRSGPPLQRGHSLRSSLPRGSPLTLASIIFLAEFFPKGHSASLAGCQCQGDLARWEGSMPGLQEKAEEGPGGKIGAGSSCPDLAAEQIPELGEHATMSFVSLVSLSPRRQECTEPQAL